MSLDEECFGYSMAVQTELLANSCHRQTRTAKFPDLVNYFRSELTVSAVYSLLRGSSPATVAGFVVSVVIDSVKSHTRRLLAHVFQEVTKVSPAITHCDTTAAPVFPAVVSRVRTASNHVRPGMVCRRSACASLSSVLRGPRDGKFPLKAPAALVPAVSKHNAISVTLIPARAQAAPVGVAAAVRETTQHSEPAERLSGEIFSLSHTRIIGDVRRSPQPARGWL
jgi:hypothetical protein